MPSTYSVAITGIKAGVTKEEAARKLAALFEVPEQKAATIIESGKFPVKRGVDLKSSVKYEEALDQCGLTCVVEPDSDSISFDIGDPQESTSKQADSSPTPAQTENAASQAMSAFLPWWVWGVGASILAGIAGFMFLSNLGTISGAFSGESKFDVASQVGKSTQAEMDKFVEAGGLENKSEAKWRGYQVTSYQASHDEQTGLLGIINIGLWSGDAYGHKFANVSNVKESLSKECGDNWAQNEAQRSANMYVASNSSMTCSIAIGKLSTDGIRVSIMMDPEALRASNASAADSSDPVEQEVSDCVDRKIAELRGTPGHEDDPVPMPVLDEWEGECRSKVRSAN